MNKSVIKRSGLLVDFDKKILARSLVRSGASEDYALQIAKEIEKEINNGEHTSSVYKKAFDFLYKDAKHIAIKYSLKKALFDLGPTGFPFEKFVAEIFRRKGYVTVTNIILEGHCISHEVDVLTTSPEKIAMEIKFHNNINTRSDVKSVLYVKSRFDDLMYKNKIIGNKNSIDRCILVTNTKFTTNAIKYAKCAGVDLLSWGYPNRENLEKYIRDINIHPVTCLPSIKRFEILRLFELGIITCKGLLENKNVLKTLKNFESVLEEAQMICEIKT